METILIGFGSKAKVGKDFIVSALSGIYDIERISFADELKEDLAVALRRSGFDFKELLADPVKKELVRPLMVAYSETLKRFDQEIWVKRALENKMFTTNFAMITDMRFPIEIDYIRKLGGIYVEIAANVPPANEVEAYYSPRMALMADYTVKNEFDGKFIDDMLTLIEEIKKNRYGSTAKDKDSYVLWP